MFNFLVWVVLILPLTIIGITFVPAFTLLAWGCFLLWIAFN